MDLGSKNNRELIEEIESLRNKLEEYEGLKTLRNKETRELGKINRALRTLSGCNQALVRATDEAKFMNEVCNIIINAGAYRLAWIGYVQNDEFKSVTPVAQAGFESGYLKKINITLADKERDQGPVGLSIKTRQPVIIKDTLTDPSFNPWKEDALNQGYHSVISLPLLFKEKCYGALAIYSAEINYFDEAEVELLNELSKDLAYGITVLRNEIERQNFERELKDSEENYRKLVEISPDAISVHVNGKFVYINESGLKIIGATKLEDIIGKSVLDIVHPDYRQAVIERILRVLEGANVPALEEKFLRLDGQTIDVIVAASNIMYKGQKAVQIVVNDITGLKKAENILRESEERFRSIFENAPLGMFRTSIDGDMLLANDAFVKMLGYSSFEELSKIDMKSIYADSKFREKYIGRIKETGRAIGYETELIKKDGSLIFIRFNARYISNLAGSGYFLEGTIEDITVRKKIEEELIKAKDKAEEINRIKSSFLANMSHELRTPLVAILGFAEIFQAELTDKIQLEMADSIYASGRRLLETLNSILDLSKIEANKIEVNKEKVNVSNLVKEDVSLFTSFANQKGLTIHPVIKNENAVGNLDSQMVHKIINNLVNNAIKYTLKGGVTVIVDTTEEDEKCWIKISVQDTGIGIPAKSLSLIFEEFRQVSEGLGRNFEGAGLGLTITKKFIEMLDGKISVTSKEDVGTEFTVFLPALETVKEKEVSFSNDISTKPQDEKKLLPRILLVENDLPTIDVTRIILRQSYYIEIESTGLEAIEAARKTMYEAILMDINLGAGMNGTEAMKKIRELPGYKDRAIVAFTAYAMMGDRERFLKEGFSEYIAKPFEKKTLIDLLKKIFNKE